MIRRAAGAALSFTVTARDNFGKHRGRWTSVVSAISRAAGGTDVFVRGADRAVWHMAAR